MAFVGEPATQKQIDYIEILLNDVGLWHHRKDMLQLRFKKEHVSDLYKHQASAFIGELKEIKERGNPSSESLDLGDRGGAFRND